MPGVDGGRFSRAWGAASIGVATLSREAPDLPSLLERADKALYKAKRHGRNRVETWLV